MKIFGKTQQQQKGFTLIELVVAIIIIGILASALVATFKDTSTSASTAAKDASEAAVKSELAMYLAVNKTFPTVEQLATASNGTADALGVQVTINSTAVNIKTFTNTTCATATSATTDTVKCVKGYADD